MKIRLPNEQARKLEIALRKAGSREIGGQIFAEQLAPSDFLVTELTVQSRRGSVARFVVDLVQAARDALRFFDKTGHRYTQFNYLGEWHSHPSFAVQPSSVDLRSMRDIVADRDFRGTFAVLMIVKLDCDQLKAGAWFFDPRGLETLVDVEIEHDEKRTHVDR